MSMMQIIWSPSLVFVLVLTVTDTQTLFAEAPLSWQHRPSGGPARRSHHAVAYDSARRVTVLFGGHGSGYAPDEFYKDETWEWDGATWMLRSVEGPPGRNQHAIAYDSRRGVTVLFGGTGIDGTLGDTWEWDGEEWTLRTLSGPSPRTRHTLSYDSQRGVTVLFGGEPHGGETWEWDGATWTLRSVTGPWGRRDSPMAYDSRRGVTVLFGGFSSAGIQGDTWEWNGVEWTRIYATGPAVRHAYGMAYDSDRGVVVLLGGRGVGGPPSYFELYDDTWEWDGTAWTELDVSGPPARWFSAMAYDNTRHVIVSTGGTPSPLSGFTWELGRFPLDTDGDGIDDLDDACPYSDLTENILIDDCETHVGNVIFEDGCAMADLIASCGDGAQNHGEYVRCVADLTRDWRRSGLISPRQQGRVQRCAARADIPGGTGRSIRRFNHVRGKR